MLRSIALVLSLFIMVGALVSCTNEAGMHPEQPHAAGPRKVPARSWLASNKNANPLASNRFGTAVHAREFVESLFVAGAVEVNVVDPMEEPSRIKLEGGPYADTVVIRLPSDSAKRKSLFAIAATEAQRQGFTPTPDTGQAELVLWWD